MTLVLDHLAITAPTLEQGRAFAEDALGLAMGPGGRHDVFGTHNLLLRLGDIYLEVIAPDPSAAPARPRWFGLDDPGAVRLGNWIARVKHLSTALNRWPQAGRATDLTRGALRWRIGVPADGSLPMQGGFPTLIEWAPGAHPLDALPDSGARLTGLTVTHPQAGHLRDMLAPHLTDPRIRFVPGAAPALSARIDTAQGPRRL